jgi:hypothetical protein
MEAVFPFETMVCTYSPLSVTTQKMNHYFTRVALCRFLSLLEQHEPITKLFQNGMLKCVGYAYLYLGERVTGKWEKTWELLNLKFPSNIIREIK